MASLAALALMGVGCASSGSSETEDDEITVENGLSSIDPGTPVDLVATYDAKRPGKTNQHGSCTHANLPSEITVRVGGRWPGTPTQPGKLGNVWPDRGYRLTVNGGRITSGDGQFHFKLGGYLVFGVFDTTRPDYRSNAVLATPLRMWIKSYSAIHGAANCTYQTPIELQLKPSAREPAASDQTIEPSSSSNLPSASVKAIL